MTAQGWTHGACHTAGKAPRPASRAILQMLLCLQSDLPPMATSLRASEFRSIPFPILGRTRCQTVKPAALSQVAGLAEILPWHGNRRRYSSNRVTH